MLSGFSLFDPASLLTRARRTPKRRELQRLQIRRRLLLEQLEDRRLLAINLTYGGTGNPLELFDLDGSADTVTISNMDAETLLIDLGGTATFGPSSITCLLYTSPSPRDRQKSRMPSSA